MNAELVMRRVPGVRKISIRINPLNLNKHPQKIMNMVKIATELVFIDNAVELKTQAIKQFESKRPGGSNEKKLKSSRIYERFKIHMLKLAIPKILTLI